MKKFFAFIFFLFIYYSASSQVGIKAGLNTSYFDKYHNYESGFVGGFYARLGKGILTLQPELVYEHKGAYNKVADCNFNTYYAQGNLLGSVNIGPVSLQAGGYAARLLFASNSNWWRTKFTWPTNHWIYNQWDYGFLGGAEVDLYGASVGFRYEHGLRQVVNDEESSTGLHGAKNVGMNIYLAVPFTMRK